jgi:radical SAM superfamily enzyme YgiQ (UPF0313 family)
MSFEQGPIRPPSEAESLFIRVTRNCPWNKCLFCPSYKRKKFSRRTVEEIKKDIGAIQEALTKVKSYALKLGEGLNITRRTLEVVYHREPELLQVAFWLFRGGKNVFLQDGDNLVMPAEQLAEVLSLIREQFPTVERITTYSRAKTVTRRSVSELQMVREAGLNRIHIGLESGHDPLLEYMRKGVTAAEHIEAGLKVKEAGLSLSEYVLLGLGGHKMWREHALDTAKVLSAIDPHFIRIRTLTVRGGTPLQEKIRTQEFQLLDDDGVVHEERLLLENLRAGSYVVSDHILNLLEEIEGDLSRDRETLLGVIDRYLGMPGEKRANFRIGRRLGLYRYLRDMGDMQRYSQVEAIRKRLVEEGRDEEEFLEECRRRYV